MKTPVRELPGKVLLYGVLIAGVVITVFPFFWMFVLATLSRREIFGFPPELWFGDYALVNMSNLLGYVPFLRNMWNSFYIAGMATVTALFFCSLAAFGFAMYEFKFKRTLFIIMISTLMIPPVLTIIPWFILMRFFGWVNEPRALWLPGMANAFGIFLLKQYIESAVPKDFMDAGRIDGCTEFRIYRSIILPVITPGLGALGMITFINNWNNFLQALIILRERTAYTIPVALSSLQGMISTDYGAVMFGTAISTLPILIAFIFFSNRIIEGLTAGAVKG